jgi:LCP family protein required for cell wall assembly
MPTLQEGRPRARSSFAAAFLSLIFPGLGHLYAGAYMRALAFAAPPILLLALGGGIFFRMSPADKLGFAGMLIQPDVLWLILIINLLVLGYRIVAAVDAWRVANFLNRLDGTDTTQIGGTRLALRPLSLAGLLAVLLVMSGVHIALAKYDLDAQGVACIFDATTNGCTGDDSTPSPGDTGSPDPSIAGQSAAPSLNVGTPVPGASAAVGPTPAVYTGGRLNILLIGADQRPKDNTFNTDTMIVVSIDPDSKQVAMFQLPRDVVDVPLPPGSAQNTFGPVYRGKINSLWTAATLRPDLFPGNTAVRGYNALKATLGYLYGIPIDYYVEVNFDGFKQVIDTLGGVTINVQMPVTDDYYPGDDGRLHRVYIPTGIQHMTGAQALVYARSRHGSNDFDRGQRQQRVLLSLREQANVGQLISHFSDLVKALRSAVHTDIPISQLQKLLPLVATVDTTNIRSYVFAPPLYGTEVAHGDPRGYIIEPAIQKIRIAVANAFKVDPKIEALRQKVAEENGVAWVLNGSNNPTSASDLAAYLEYMGVTASAPNQAPTNAGSQTKIVAYNGAAAKLPATIQLLEQVLGVKHTNTTDKSVKADIIITTAGNTPDLTPPPAP